MSKDALECELFSYYLADVGIATKERTFSPNLISQHIVLPATILPEGDGRVTVELSQGAKGEKIFTRLQLAGID